MEAKNEELHKAQNSIALLEAKNKVLEAKNKALDAKLIAQNSTEGRIKQLNSQFELTMAKQCLPTVYTHGVSPQVQLRLPRGYGPIIYHREQCAIHSAFTSSKSNYLKQPIVTNNW